MAPGVQLTKKQYAEIVAAAEELFTTVAGRAPRSKELIPEFFAGYDSAVADLNKFYGLDRPAHQGPPGPRSGDYTYLLIVDHRSSPKEPFFNEGMLERFGTTHTRRTAGGVRITAGYLGAGTGGVGMRWPRSRWVNPARPAPVAGVKRPVRGKRMAAAALTPRAERKLLRSFARGSGVPTTFTGTAAAKALVRAHAADLASRAAAPTAKAARWGRPGTTSEAYKRIIMEHRGKLNDTSVHDRVVAELGKAKAGPPSYAGWYRRWLVKHGHLKG